MKTKLKLQTLTIILITNNEIIEEKLLRILGWIEAIMDICGLYDRLDQFRLS